MAVSMRSRCNQISVEPGVLKLHGFRVLRFWNNEVLANIEAVLERIYQVIDQPSPFPLPKRARVKKMTPSKGL
jgi:hypothetical protein